MNLIKLLICFLLSVACGNPAMADATCRLRVLSYNIHHGEGLDGRLDLARIAEIIRATDADIVALQEVDQNVPRTKNIDQPAELARMLEMRVAFGANLDLQGGKYGNAVLTRLPIVHFENTLLPSMDQGEQRGVLAVDIKLEAMENPLGLLATHFDFRRDDSERLAAVDTINAMAASQGEGPMILAGDLNSLRASPTLMRLEEKWLIAGDREQPTSPSAQPKRQIDFILAYPRERWRVVETQVLDEAVASDHRAILAILEYDVR